MGEFVQLRIVLPVLLGFVMSDVTVFGLARCTVLVRSRNVVVGAVLDLRHLGIVLVLGFPQRSLSFPLRASLALGFFLFCQRLRLNGLRGRHEKIIDEKKHNQLTWGTFAVQEIL